MNSLYDNIILSDSGLNKVAYLSITVRECFTDSFLCDVMRVIIVHLVNVLLFFFHLFLLQIV